ncbi:uncharacterized protein MYCFIDRAFT_193651 [Pseudocercospora fijiensis CIRAD86]|uniref:F-box domain-containing protein n=1 Tax=Pseudocercospora fijiensis (strain CIRAD86) TaxID=383855 RepID=M3A2A9_PSEFD|nr:uncharacterized protein MYCFIDRAFT_193651 [Pseudocercospora fijiensis CIRAD86]EME85309.1 hypothetical protein MYCFIDRAFT_193651 [Pseudocercospora fijiensis CIRAD86]
MVFNSTSQIVTILLLRVVTTYRNVGKGAVDYINRHIDLPIHIENISNTEPSIPKPDSQYQSLRSKNKFTSPLLHLPRELRDIILTFISDASPPPLDARRSPLPSLLSVSSQLRDEFAQIFYSRKLILAGGAPSPSYEKKFFQGFCQAHKKYVKRVHWLWDSYGTKEQAVARARELDAVSFMQEGTWTVGYIDGFGIEEGKRCARRNHIDREPWAFSGLEKRGSRDASRRKPTTIRGEARAVS